MCLRKLQTNPKHITTSVTLVKKGMYEARQNYTLHVYTMDVLVCY